MTLTTLSEADFPEGITSLIIIKAGVLHTLLGKKRHGQFEVTNPWFGDKKIYSGFMDFLEKREKIWEYFLKFLKDPKRFLDRNGYQCLPKANGHIIPCKQ
ncbi:hypothetical protein PGH43_03935 [Legionella pneumophila 130b]|nr:hypothetical protein PGH43_03935 [Legionella pneumophila 130b]